MSAGEPLHLHLDIDRQSAPVSGQVRPEGAAPRSFVGWTELFVALQEAIAGDDQPQGAERPENSSDINHD